MQLSAFCLNNAWGFVWTAALESMSSLKQSLNITQDLVHLGFPVLVLISLYGTPKKEPPYAILIQFRMLDYLPICD